MSKHATLFTDGGSRGNPGPAGIGFVLKIGGGEAIEKGEAIGKATNNQAEYRALLAGLARAQREKVPVLDVFMDSELVVKQIKGEYRVKDVKLVPLFAEVEEALEGFEKVTFKHVKRDKNKRADWLVNKALDRK